jgi:2-oxoglutarate dehydrogenase E1 component
VNAVNLPADNLAFANKDYIAEQYRRYKADPSSVDQRWAFFFAGFELGADGGGVTPTAAAAVDGVSAEPVLGVFDLIHSYRELGHLVAHLNPLEPKPAGHPLLEPAEFGFGEADLERVVEGASFRGPFRGTVRELITQLQATYCRTIGVEYMHIQHQDQRVWLRERMEPTLNHPRLSVEYQLQTLEQLTAAEVFEQFLQTRFPTSKRFSLEGGESLIPILRTLLEDGAALGVEEMVLGMPHRGRLNVLAHVLRKPYEMILAEFEGTPLAADAIGDGDVKYHQGFSRDHRTQDGRVVHVSLSPNPSHLEAINPVIEGIVYAKQRRRRDGGGGQVVPVLIHGDAAFTGQGVAYETLALSELEGYRTGGTLHIIINNQVGFTTPPQMYRFTPYPSDVAKIIQAPVFHVNGDDPEAAIQAARLAIGFRQQFRKDVFIDLVCYRKRGHNELDDPTFTQPVMYRRIAAKTSPATLYRERLVAANVLTREEADRQASEIRSLLDDAHDYARDFMPRQQVFAFGGLWKGLGWPGSDWSASTGVSRELLVEIATACARLPAGFTPHPRVQRLLAARAAAVVEDGEIDWPCAEMLALGSLAVEGVPVRLSGQDSGRGTFSQRHAVLHDTNTGACHVPLDGIRDGQARVDILDSMLSENAVLGFEFGLSLADPHRLVLWEAQYGDFANGAQVVIDQFVAASESKWARMSGLVLLLPHGYEGQGPEHSSARLERFLQLCAEDNVQVCCPTTPAQLFHLLRRQVHRSFRKPLVILTPKSLLRHKLVVSPVRDLTDSAFQPVLDDPAPTGTQAAGTPLERGAVRRILLCTGKIYYTLLAERAERGADTVAIVRLEQLHPFPAQELHAVLRTYPGVQDVWWAQEEPRNMGAWTFVSQRLVLPGDRTLAYIGRPEAASPATGVYKVHVEEEAALVAQAFAR